ncbi:hypothetical protein FEM21_28150 [Flavobacterium seoulense]|uniref:Uncharacterized protein n=1 Tax=Flavobacterium seoulense TaxID=1492738 RepID=A0A066WN17_9FLAO|nr:hypothetical protein FEM21_28150 [Flavobacterium seoulense]
MVLVSILEIIFEKPKLKNHLLISADYCKNLMNLLRKKRI